LNELSEEKMINLPYCERSANMSGSPQQ